METEKQVVCSGRTAFTLMLGIFFWCIGVGVTLLILISEATYEVIGVFILFLILCGVEGSYFLLYWYNKRIIVTWNEIMYRSIWGLERKYSWKDVKSVCYKSTGRGADRILIWTNKKIYIETGMMKRSEEAERLIKEKGYLQVNLITDRKKG